MSMQTQCLECDWEGAFNEVVIRIGQNLTRVETCPECLSEHLNIIVNDDMKGELQEALYELLEWACGNRGRKEGNPYGIPSVQQALEVLAVSCGKSKSAWLDAKEIYRSTQK